MSRRNHPPTIAVGIAGKWRRDGKRVSVVKGEDTLILLDASSLRKAKRYFRTGKESR
jgi:hypothetical protein